MHYVEHLSRDRKLKKLILDGEKYTIKKRRNICNYLCASIMSQQLSVKVATVIHNRFLALFDGRPPTPQQILDMPTEKLRSIGLSNAKASYVKNVARFDLDFGMDQKKLQKMTNEEVIAYLTQIKGVGKWTVEMLLMFVLGREDVLAVDDHERRIHVMMEETGVTVSQPPQIGFGNVLFKMDGALLYPLNEGCRSGLQINYQVGLGSLGLEMLIDLSVKLVFSVIQREPGEQRIFVEQEIADRGLRKQVDLSQTL